MLHINGNLVDGMIVVVALIFCTGDSKSRHNGRYDCNKRFSHDCNLFLVRGILLYESEALGVGSHDHEAAVVLVLRILVQPSLHVPSCKFQVTGRQASDDILHP